MQNTVQNKYTGDSLVKVRTVVLTSEFGSSARGERQNYYNADHIIWPHKHAAHLVMFKISVCRHPKNPSTFSTAQSQLQLNGRELNSLSTWSNVNPQLTSFLKSSNSQPISSGYDVIHTPASFSVWGLLWHVFLKLFPFFYFNAVIRQSDKIHKMASSFFIIYWH